MSFRGFRVVLFDLEKAHLLFDVDKMPTYFLTCVDELLRVKMNLTRKATMKANLLLSSLCLVLSAANCFASDPVTYHAEYSLIANPLDNGLGNHLNDIINNNVVPPLPDGCCLSKWVNGTAVPTWEQSVYNLALNKWIPNNTLSPGEGAWLYNPSGAGTAYVITYNGSNLGQRSTAVSYTSGNPYLFGAQGDSPNCVDYAGLTGGNIPANLTKVYSWDEFSGYHISTYFAASSSWVGGAPSICIGHSVWIVYPGSTGVPSLPACSPCPPPINDECSAAIQVFAGPCAAAGTTVCATPSVSGSIPAPCGLSAAAPDVWYYFKPVCDGVVTIDTIGLCLGQSAAFDTVLSVYTGACGSLVTVACNNDAGGVCNPQSRVTFTGNHLLTYYIRVAGKVVASGEFRLNIIAPAAPPSNDDCAGAIALTSGSPAALGSTECATPSPSGSIPVPCGSSVNSRDLWYTFTPTCTGPVTIDTCGNLPCPLPPGTFDTVLSVYTGVCGSLTTVACNNNGGAGCGNRSRVTFTGNALVTYYIRVAGAGAAVRGRFRLNISSPSPTVPLNDLCSSATPIGNGTHAFNTCLATPDSTPTGCQPNNDVWFLYTPTCNGTVWINTCNSSFDTMLAVYSGLTGTPATDCNTLTYIDCNDNASTGPCGSPNSFLTVPVTASTPYYIRVGGAAGATGAGKLNVQGPFPPVPTCSAPSGPLFTRVFKIMGPGNGTHWSWSIGIPCCVNIEDIDVTGVTTSNPDVLAQTFATSINNACPLGRVVAVAYNITANPGLLGVTVSSCSSSATPFIFRVGIPFAAQSDQCVVASGNNLPTSGACSFNPEIIELPLSGNDFNTNSLDDALDIMNGASADLNLNGIPDEVEPCVGLQLATVPESQIVELGTNVTFSVSATGTEPLSYQWNLAEIALVDGGNISGANSNVLSIQNISLADLGDYTVTITNACDSVTTLPVTLSQKTAGPPILRPALIDGNFGFAFNGEMEVVYVIEYTDDLASTSWTELETVTGYGQEVEITDSAPLPSARFYRVRPLP